MAKEPGKIVGNLGSGKEPPLRSHMLKEKTDRPLIKGYPPTKSSLCSCGQPMSPTGKCFACGPGSGGGKGEGSVKTGGGYNRNG